MLPLATNNLNQRNWKHRIINWWNGTPFLNKATITGVCILYLLNLLTKDALFYFLADIPSETLNIPTITSKYFEVWRIFTAFIVNPNIMSVIFCLICLESESCRLEKVLGTTAFFVDLIIKNVEIQIFYIFIIFILHFRFPELLLLPSYGLWELLMVYITIRSASNSEQPTQLLCLPIIIKSKYYPILIILLLSLILMTPISLIAALIVGYFETYFFNGLIIRLSISKAVWLEKLLFGCVKTRPDFIAVENSDIPYYLSDDNQNSLANLGAPLNNSNATASNNNSIGGRGVVILEASNNPALPQRPPPQHPVCSMKKESQNQQRTSLTTMTKLLNGKDTILGSELSARDDGQREIENINKDESLTELTSQDLVPQGKYEYVSLFNEKK